MGEIKNYNFDGKCQEEYCDEDYTHCEWIEIYGLNFMILFCEKHWDKFINAYLEAKNGN